MRRFSARELAAALHGTVNGRWINIPGPGHRSHDRSLGFLLDQTAPGGFRLNSFAAGDDPAECRAYIEALLKEAANGGRIVSEGGRTDYDEIAEEAKIRAALTI